MTPEIWLSTSNSPLAMIPMNASHTDFHCIISPEFLCVMEPLGKKNKRTVISVTFSGLCVTIKKFCLELVIDLQHDAGVQALRL
jgi:hypothetical protein